MATAKLREQWAEEGKKDNEHLEYLAEKKFDMQEKIRQKVIDDSF